MATPAYKLRNSQERYDAIAALAKQEGFKTVTEYLGWLLDQRAKEIGFDLPPQEAKWGGARQKD
jgi:hypothetical protein